MKTIGLIGGMSWESSSVYYRLINEEVRARLGGLNSAQVLLYSFNFQQIEQLQKTSNWLRAGELMCEAALALERGGADCLVLCTNTMHKLAPEIIATSTLPFLHIADATAAKIKSHNIERVGLLGTKFTMEEEFYANRLRQQHGLQVDIPNQAERDLVHEVIYQELCAGIVSEDSRARYRRIMQNMVTQGAQGIILGCTEIALLVSPEDASVPMFDTCKIHAEYAVDFALS